MPFSWNREKTMRQQSRWLRLSALMLGLSLVAAACGGDDDDDDATSDTTAAADEDEGATAAPEIGDANPSCEGDAQGAVGIALTGGVGVTDLGGRGRALVLIGGCRRVTGRVVIVVVAAACCGHQREAEHQGREAEPPALLSHRLLPVPGKWHAGVRPRCGSQVYHLVDCARCVLPPNCVKEPSRCPPMTVHPTIGRRPGPVRW